jgi:hypothetical protein
VRKRRKKRERQSVHLFLLLEYLCCVQKFSIFFLRLVFTKIFDFCKAQAFCQKTYGFLKHRTLALRAWECEKKPSVFEQARSAAALLRLRKSS